ncbi:unnamed protein product [Sphenostylis stenocarpa]|uniref:Nuclear pore complex protein NUP214 n=1 Tax=Sphenostylis stenocarpa TaxID=92480 RepID=A0AA86VXU7_9FABA|nr:unnamed protein product [Sphenostylis stenocarpa]
MHASCQLAINANMKNTDQHIMLLGWSADDDKSEAAVIDIERDKWVPRIELQVGLCVDNVSIYQNVGVQLGVEERTELSPYCVLICLTLEGKLVMFHVASLAGNKVLPEIDSALHSDEYTSVNLPEDKGYTFSQGLQKQESDKTFEVSGNLVAKPSDNPQQITCTDTKYTEVKLVANSRSLKSNVDVDANQDTGNHNPFRPGEQQNNFGQKTAALGTSIGSLTVNSHSASPGLSSYNNIQATTEKTRELWTANSSRDPQKASNLLPGETFSFPKKSDVSSVSASTYADGVGFQDKNYTIGASNFPGIGGKPFVVKDMNNISPAFNSTGRLFQTGGQLSPLVSGNTQPVLNSSSSRMSSDGNTAAIKSSRKFLSSNEQHGTSSKLGISSSDLSKQFGNINEMTKELDLLLRSVEDAGGFKDACTRSLQSAIEAVEQGMDSLLVFYFSDLGGAKSLLLGFNLRSPNRQVSLDVELVQKYQMRLSPIVWKVYKRRKMRWCVNMVVGSAMWWKDVRTCKGVTDQVKEMWEIVVGLQQNLIKKSILNVEEKSEEFDAILDFVLRHAFEFRVGFEVKHDLMQFLIRMVRDIDEQTSIDIQVLGHSDLDENTPLCQVDEHHEEVHYLLNKTIRVMARKIYMEGIYKQASDSRYWDLWNRQKLNSELELKRQYILNLNQDLTNQLIELERHFNALELNKFSQNGARDIGHGPSQNRCGPSRPNLQYMEKGSKEGDAKTNNGFEGLGKRMQENDRNSAPSLISSKIHPIIHAESPFLSSLFIWESDLLLASFAYGLYVQSFHSLHSAISSQLVAAENLSECLSKQMSVLSLRSQTEERKNVKELFETIGIPYEAAFVSPDMKCFMKTPPSKKIFSDLTVNKDHSRRDQSSAMKSCEPETARRRRDSLDQSWTCFEPPKTIVKRMLLQELQKLNRNDSLYSMNKEKKVSTLEGPAPRSTDARLPSIVFPSPKMKASILDSHLEHEVVSEHSKAFISADSLRVAAHVSESMSSALQKSDNLSIPSRPAFHLSPTMMSGHSPETEGLAAEKSTVQKFDLILNSENKPTLNWKIPQKSSIPTYSTTETPPVHNKSSEMAIANSKMTMATSSTTVDKLSNASTPDSLRNVFPSSESLGITSASSTFFGKVTDLHVAKSLPKENVPAVPTFGGSFKSLLSSTAKTTSSLLSSSASSTAMPPVAVSVTSNSLTSLNTNTDSNNDMSSSSSSAFLHSSNQRLKDTVSSLPDPPCLNSALESLKPEIQPVSVLKSAIPPASVLKPDIQQAALLKSDIQPAAVSNSKTDSDAAAEVVTRLNEAVNNASELKLGSSIKFSPTIEQSSKNITSFDLNAGPVSQAARPSDAPLQFSTSFLSSATVSNSKNEGLDVGISHEDEMEEEAPETSNNTTELRLGSFGGFGISSSPNPSMPKSNPFGGSFNNVATSLSSSTVTFSVPSGELFKPASFTFSNPQSSAPTQPTNSGAFSGGFNSVAAVPTQGPSGFGNPAQIGSGQQVLGSVLGGFGQSRQLGSGLPGNGFAAPSSYGGGYGGSSSTSGFANTAIGGGFAGIASTGGGFAGVASAGSGFSGGGFAGAGAPGGGFGGGGGAAPGVGFGAAAAGAPGVGFGAVSSSGGFAGAGSGGGFGAFSSQGNGRFGAVGDSKPPELFTQMRK